jgi:hypothetical protein
MDQALAWSLRTFFNSTPSRQSNFIPLKLPILRLPCF